MIDASARTFIALCPCGWRSSTHTTRIAAITAEARHERDYHPDTMAARRLLAQTRRRHRPTFEAPPSRK